MFQFPKKTHYKHFFLPVLSLGILFLPQISPSSFTPTKAEAEKVIQTPIETLSSATVPTIEIKTENSSAPTPPPVPTPQPAAATPVASTPAKTGTLSLKIDSIKLNIPLGKTSLDKYGHLAVPADASKAAWYTKGPQPGAPGTGLITGHYDSAAGPGVFYYLDQVQVGDVITVTKTDGTLLTYKVDKVASYYQDDRFPWKDVYSTKGPSAIRIITCDGTYNPKTGRYSHNFVVYASLQTT